MAAAIRVLYVDDESDLLDIGKMFLEESGEFTVTTALNATEALRLLEQKKFETIISDYQMPGMDGIQFLVEVRTRFGPIPFILFTGRGREEVVIQAINSGADFYLQKGGEPGAQFAELTHKVRQAIARCNAEKQIKQSEEKFSAAFTISPDPVAITDLKTGTLININPTFSAWSGYSSDELIGKTTKELNFWANTHDRDEIVAALQAHKNITDKAIELRIKNGDIRNCLFSARIISIDGNDYLFTRSRDITESKLAEAVLRESEERFRNVIDATGEYVFEIDKHGVITFISDRVKDILGYEPQELIGKTPFDLMVSSEEVARVSAIFGEYLRNKLPFRRMEHNCLSKDGRELVLMVTALPILDSAGELKGYQGTVEDITERKLSEEKLRQRNDAMEAAIDGMALLNADQNYSYMNNAHAAIYGYDNASELIGRSWRGLYDPDELQRFEQEIMPELGRIGYYRGKATGRKKDKSTFPQEISLTTLKDGGLICVVRDITDRKRAEETLKESEEFNRTLIENLPDYIIVYRPDGKILYVNPATVKGFGYNLNELVGTSVISYVAPECRTRVTAAIATRLKGDDTPEYETVLITKEGQQKTVIAKGTLVRYHDGLATLLLLTDITERKVAERVLLESEEKYRVIFNNDIYAICIFDLETLNLLDVNDAFTKLYGYTRNELLSGMTVHDITAEHEASDSATGEAINRGTIFIPLRYHKKKDNTIFPVEIVGGPYLWNGKKVMFALTHDITKRKNAEETLRKSEEKYRQLIELAHEGIWAIDGNGNTTYVNQQMAKILGYTAEEMLGMHLFSFMDDTGKIIAAGNMERRRQGIKEKHEFEFITKGGDRIYAHLSTSPIIDEKGVYLGALAVVTDITERKVAEEALKEHDEKIHLLLDSTAEAIFGLDMNGNCTFCNNSCLRMLGYKSPDELLGRNMHWQIHHKYKDGTHFPVEDCRIFRVFNKGEGTHVDDEVLWRSDGTSFQAEYWSYPQRHEGNVVGAVVTFIDITERKELEKEMEYHALELRKFSSSLATANKKLTLLSSITRHDINNQLTVLMGFLTILKKKQPDPLLNEYFVKVSNAAQRISSMIQFTREYENIGVNAPVWQDCHTLVDTAAKQAPLGQVTVKNDLPAGAELFADPLVVKVFYNLMDNAVRYGEKITTIRFSVEEAGDGDHLIVCEDDGNGVVADEKEKIFERGFGKNTGLGLALSREILSITGITISENGEPGKGARFEMTVPKGAWRSVRKRN